MDSFLPSLLNADFFQVFSPPSSPSLTQIFSYLKLISDQSYLRSQKKLKHRKKKAKKKNRVERGQHSKVATFPVSRASAKIGGLEVSLSLFSKSLHGMTGCGAACILEKVFHALSSKSRTLEISVSLNGFRIMDSLEEIDAH